MKTVFLRTPYNYDMNSVSDETGLRCEDESLADQSQADDCDINTIVRRFGLTGELPDNFSPPQYGDFTGIGTYQDALNAVMAAEDSFMQMPADLRARFHNNPEELMAFLADERNRGEAFKLGLITKDVEPPLTPPVPSPAA